MSSGVRLLFVGLGSVGRRHLDNARNLGVTDIHAWRSGHTSLATPEGVVAHRTLGDALSAKPSAVVICNPTSEHIPVALAAANAGCHLFIEKPLSHSLDGVDDLVALARRHCLVSLMGLTLRFHPALRMLADIVHRGDLGRVVSIRAQVGQFLPDWRPTQDYRQSYSARRELGGGVILDLIHEIDYVRWLGGEIVSVMCQSGSLAGLEIDTEDVAEIVVRFEGGAIGSIHLDYVQRAGTRSCTVIGIQGTAVVDLLVPEVRIGRPGGEWQTLNVPAFQRNDMFVAQMRHFLAALAGQETPVVDLESGARLQRIATCAHASNANGRLEQVRA